MPRSVPSTVMEWLRDTGHPPVPADWVPGADHAELAALNALGGIVRDLLAHSDTAKIVPSIAEWLLAAPVAPAEVLAEVRALVALDGDAALASLYSELVSSENRRQLGTFFTPGVEVNYMIELWASTYGSPGSVVDVGAGVGVFTASAAKTWPGADVISVDVNRVTLGLLGARLATPSSDEKDADIGRATLVLEDFTKWIAGRGFADLRGPRLILGNPPYTRGSLLGAEERERLHVATDMVCGLRASLSTIITAISIKYLAPEDGLCLLLPAQWLESDYARGLREKIWLLKRPVNLRLVESGLFDDAQVDAVVLMIGPERLGSQFDVSSWDAEAERVLDRGDDVPQNWRRLFDAPTDTAIEEAEGTFCLEDVASVRRGVATGANSFFVLTEAKRILSGLASQWFVPAVKRLRDIPGEFTSAAIDDQDRFWMLSATSADRGEDTALSEYIAAGEADGLNLGHLCANRHPWYDLETEMYRPDVIIGAMSRTDFHVVNNVAGAAITNNLYGWIWNERLDAAQRSRLVAWLRSDTGQDRLRLTARRGGDGLLKLEPKALRLMRVPLTALGTDYPPELRR
jgi:hypothetical protein